MVNNFKPFISKIFFWSNVESKGSSFTNQYVFLQNPYKQVNMLYIIDDRPDIPYRHVLYKSYKTWKSQYTNKICLGDHVCPYNCKYDFERYLKYDYCILRLNYYCNVCRIWWYFKFNLTVVVVFSNIIQMNVFKWLNRKYTNW